jgi:hypothetical protein
VAARSQDVADPDTVVRGAERALGEENDRPAVLAGDRGSLFTDIVVCQCAPIGDLLNSID